MPSNPKNFNVDNVRVVKIMGGSLSGSAVVRGMVFGREPEGMFSHIYINDARLTVGLPKVSSSRSRRARSLSSPAPWTLRKRRPREPC